jgi:hypothetical protein
MNQDGAGARGRGSRTAIVAVVVATVAVLAAAAAIIIVLSRDEGSAPAGAGGAPATTSVSGAAPSNTPSTSEPPRTSTTAPSRPPADEAFGYQPLWPFSSAADAQRWQRAYRSGGHGPWHLDADATAIAFTTGYLRFTHIDTVVRHSVHGREATVTVGYRIDAEHAPPTAAVVHLARYGAGSDAPWEVVGTKDTTLTLSRPPYGTAARSPMTVGGTISGVDESIRVQVRQPTVSAPIGQATPIPAGGEARPWSVTVSFRPATGAVMTVVASTGGHVAEVERFAVTGVRPIR